MMKQEFEERANFKISLECYHSLIEPEYNASKLDKDEWVKEWKKNGGIQAAYDWERTNRNLAEKDAKRTKNTIESVTEKRDYYMKLAKDYSDKANELDEANKVAERQAEALNNRIKSLAEFMIQRGVMNGDKVLLAEAASILGEKAYITYKLENNIELTDEDKKFILANLK
jgi:hypothetical protein